MTDPAPDLAGRARRGMARDRRHRLGLLAVKRGWISPAQLDEAERRPGPLGGELVAAGWISPEQLRELVGELRESEAGDPPRPAEAPVLTGQARYEIQELIGEGGMASVYRGIDRELGRTVAMKMLKESTGGNETLRQRIRQEARAIAMLSHPNVVALHDVREEEGRTCLVMEFVPGEGLDRRLALGRMDRRQSVALLEKVARAVQHAHERGIIHRDLKPSNILLTAAGEPKVGDFGLARFSGGDAGMTKTGAALGTPLYMAPEQVDGRPGEITPATDVYAMGAMLYEFLAGRVPHVGESTLEIMRKKLRDEPARPRSIDPSIPLDLEVIALKALDIEPARRYASAGAFAEDLRRWLSGEPIQARPVSSMERLWRRTWRNRAVVLPTAAALALAVGFGGWLMASSARTRDEREALRLIEQGRSILDRAGRLLHAKDGDPEEFARRVGEGRDQVDRATALAPDLSVGHYQRGRAAELLGEDEVAESAWRKAVSLDPDFAPAHFALGRLLLIRGYRERNIGGDSSNPRHDAILREAAGEIDLALNGHVGLDREIHRDVAKAMLAYGRGRLKEMREIVDSAIRRYPDEDGVEELQWLLAHKGPAEQQLGAVNAALARRPKFPIALMLRAQLLAAAGRRKEALADYDEALRWPSDVRDVVYCQRGDLRSKTGDVRGALEDMAAAMRLNPALSNPRAFRSTLRLKSGDVDGALEDASEAIRLNPGGADGYRYRARARITKGDPAGAISDMNEAVKLSPDDAALRRDRGEVRRVAGDLAGAAADFDEAVRLDPASPWGFESRARLRRIQGDLAGALEDAAKAVSLPSEDWPLREATRRLAEELRTLIEGQRDH